LLTVFTFLVKLETSSDALLPNILGPRMEIIMMGRMKIQAFHKPNSKSGISDTIFPTAPQLLVIPFYASGIKLYPKPTFGVAEKL
jgi:hypothetical protein